MSDFMDVTADDIVLVASVPWQSQSAKPVSRFTKHWGLSFTLLAPEDGVWDVVDTEEAVEILAETYAAHA